MDYFLGKVFYQVNGFVQVFFNSGALAREAEHHG